MIRVGINGFGRIGKMVFRLLNQRKDIQVVAVNDPMDLDTLVHLLRHDSVHGFCDTPAGGDSASGVLLMNGHRIKKYAFYQPEKIPWSAHRVDLVVESSGKFISRAQLKGHLQSGVSRVLLSCPGADDLDYTVVRGVNEQGLLPVHRFVSNASCTTNCAAPVIKVVDDQWGIDRLMMNTVHPYTNNQQILDGPHRDLRRARSAFLNIIPTTTSAIKAVQDVLPHLKGRFDGLATRVPVADGSFTELNIMLKKPVNRQAVNDHFYRMARGPLKGIIEYTEEPLVSRDIIGNPHSAVFDAGLTRVLGGTFLQIIAWYDNEFAYSNRLTEICTWPLG